MIKYDRIDFLELFDREIIIDEKLGIIDYEIFSTEEDLKLHVHMNIPTNHLRIRFVSHTLIDLVNITLNNIILGRWDKNQPGLARLLFYQKDKEEPVVDIYMKPGLALRLDIEQRRY